MPKIEKMTNENQVRVKEEVVDEDEDMIDDPNTLGPAALGLQRVGTQPPPKPSPSQPTQVLNARGMPARIRKKNRLFYDDDIVNTPHHRVPSAKKQKSTPRKHTPKVKSETPKTSPKKAHTVITPPRLNSPDRKIGQKIGLRLRNLLKLPKAHKWVCYEWFYSNIDRCLFSGENDFQICLKESFPELKTRDLTRAEWTKIRRMMGKPRRCSQSFFNEERLELEKKRKKIRALQQRKATDLASFKDLPPEIPMQLVIGSKVTARLRKPSDGLYTGSIDAVDTSNNTYRITFERQGLGTHSVPDYEVLSNEPPETITIASFQKKFRPRNGWSPFSPSLKNQTLKLKKDPLLSSSMINSPVLYNSMSEGKIGGFPAELLEKMVLVTKILKVKKGRVRQLRNMNLEAEKLNSFDEEIPEEFESRYASILLDLEKLNFDLQVYLNDMQIYCQEIAPEPSVAAMLAPSHLRERCQEEARDIVNKHNSVIAADKGPCQNADVLDLITDLTALMLQVKTLADSDHNAYELQVLEGTMEQIKRKLSPSNKQVFQNCVEVHMKHIEVGLTQINLDKLVIGPIGSV
ncbi:protein lin-9 homolog [Cylas formicarius]|uniref:protein lin-9 homolog n=1 Tax=Cylas formicarius TaxID=197179 RepID=UPI0029588EFE|nr:protein lin-9 homolog [Cylas formicarius]XP_060530983.1 protein lin-9 homolog [Cylas formicarius]XP_060530985.1 protein lin-9 homolog [Cylas formicarius]XP_060530986.1 protein lin-9 homolog [Cylas formicarius]XP_060531664.1 protein lin-9 homolog [Cylas formicarius]XP_060531665.1 protein lin-9 homolog [Cylas formicarius]XP_060531666.1 protein lin-9 homolog [Cylas formicarius]XP_060531667.1 protein lin-9 homolog [Cylas formicarius]